ncbi:MAG: hypothetical protein FJX75_08725 [Armatimonadetes bacterium]|nr:hypothetical protein [Armatimonadota bacterium]
MQHGVFLGAGFSCWAARLPVARELFDFAIEPFGPREAGKLARVVALKQRWDDAHPRGESEQFIAETLQMADRHCRDVLWYIARRLSEPFIWVEFHAQRWRRHVFMIDESRAPRPGAGLIGRLANASCCGIVTTNYDMIVEYALTTRGFNYGTPGEHLVGRGPYPVSQWRNPVVLRGRTPLAKVHGSISWDRTAHYTDGRRALTGEALIVAPTPEKQPPRELSAVWALAEQILRRAERLVVFGFAFNPYDLAVLNLLRDAGENVRDVLLVDPCPPLERAARLWPWAEVRATPPPAGNTDVVADWLGG